MSSIVLSDFVLTHRQSWPSDLPLVAMETTLDGTSVGEMDIPVVMYSCSFAVILLMILSQVGIKDAEGVKSISVYISWVSRLVLRSEYI